jgi:hypothetical protein
MRQMVDLVAAARAVADICERHGFSYCFIGGLAVQRWGNPRFTADVDLTIVTGFGGEEAYVDLLLKDLLPRRSDAKAFALMHRVLLARTRTGVDLDIAFGGLPFEERCVERATRWGIDAETELLTCSAEDLIVHKVFAGRDRDWDDVQGVLARRHGKLNLSIIRNELPPLLELKEAPESMTRLEQMIAVTARRLQQKS